ncbi:hypothetical protein [Streptomyces sp. NPDC049949]|uniref:hypothetical protein n=1 Tax=Streptomyces sp. NPDC049949 TaxID=3154627 RepID=UPI0034306AFC
MSRSPADSPSGRSRRSPLADLEADGYLSRSRDGRRNRYETAEGAMFRHPAEAGHEVAGLLSLLAEDTSPLTR